VSWLRDPFPCTWCVRVDVLDIIIIIIIIIIAMCSARMRVRRSTPEQTRAMKLISRGQKGLRPATMEHIFFPLYPWQVPRRSRRDDY